MRLPSQFTLILLLLCELAVAAPPLAKPDCPNRCGNTQIPYPFGIGAKCYLNEWFEIICNQTFSPPKILLSKINMEVISFPTYDPLDIGLIGTETVRVKSPVFFSNCSGKKHGEGLNLTDSPFFFSSTLNIFAAVGCNNRALLINIKPQLVGCESTCSTSNRYEGENTVCNGNRCCQDTIPSRLQVFDPSLDRINTSQSDDGCKFAFLAEEQWSNFRLIDPYVVQNRDYVPALLDWMLLNGTSYNWTSIEQKSSKSRSCYSGGNYPNAIYCSCESGYAGNPYLPDGCEDIDECKDLICGRGRTCVNTPGYYLCEPKKIENTWIMILVVGLAFGLSPVIIGARWLYKRIKKRKIVKLKKKFFKRNGGLLLEQQISSSEGNVEKTKVFSSNELEKATDHFNENRILGQGGQGTVYKGMLHDGRIVAVKKSKVVDKEKVEEFINEVVILSQINHRNVVKLLGCCLETDVPLLVYEFIPNGNLYQYLHDQKEEYPLSWEVRLQIATEVAGAISYLHSAATIPIYHRDIKSTNILLDEKFRAKVSDFGTSRSITVDQTHLTTHVQGTFGYLDPEYFRSSQFTDKSDVYSFGVVLVELLTGEKPISFTRSQDYRSLANHFILSMKENRIIEILDDQVREHCGNDEIMTVANLAKKCLSMNGKKRPTMKEVTMELEQIRLLKKDLNVENNHKEVEYVEAEVSSSWDVASTSTGSGFDGDLALSLDIETLISNKSCVW